MIARDFPVFTVTPKAERSLRAGHPWVYGEEITAVEGGYRNGDMVDVVSSKGRYLGTGWVNDHSKIRVRILSRNANDTFDEAFFRRRVRYALDYRKTVMGPADYRCCRLIFGEADQFPGLTVDRFENVLVTQTLSLGMEQRKEWVFRALVEGLREDGAEIAALYERNDVAIRELEGLRQSALVLMTTEHPFTTNFGPHDVRVTTHYYEENFISNIFTTLHEGGHALFMQNEPEEFYREYAADSMTNGMHECISRFYENLIGRSEAFIHFIYPKLQELSGGTFADVSERELYEAVNLASPGLIRCDADELTYCLHILIRYELEKAFMNGEITVDEIPALWNEKYKAYLGLDVPDDAQGCLQDVHWTMPIGYFPSYALGSAYGVQILRTMEKEIDVFGCAAKGDLLPIRDWLTQHVFSIASITTPAEWIRAITGEPLNPAYFLDYLEEKFSAIYQLPKKQ